VSQELKEKWQRLRFWQSESDEFDKKVDKIIADIEKELGSITRARALRGSLQLVAIIAVYLTSFCWYLPPHATKTIDIKEG
jgi:hypothetical protein